MEKEKNKNAVTIIITLLLVVTCLVLGWYAGGEFADKEKEIISTDTSKTENENINQETKNTTKQTLQVIKTQVGTFIIDKDGSVFFNKTVDKYEGAEINIDNYTSIATYGNYEVSDYVTGLDYDENTKKTIENHKFSGYKLALENINSAYEVKIGNGGSSEIIYFISKDGKVNELQFDSNGEKLDIKLSKDTCKKQNIVSVLQSSSIDAFDVVLVDNDGNKYTKAELTKDK